MGNHLKRCNYDCETLTMYTKIIKTNKVIKTYKKILFNIDLLNIQFQLDGNKTTRMFYIIIVLYS